MKPKTTDKEEPFEVSNKGGQTSILIYPRGGGGYVFRYYVGGKASTMERVDRDEAIKEARAIAAAINAGSTQAGKLTAADMESYVHAVTLLPPDTLSLQAVVDFTENGWDDFDRSGTRGGLP